MLGHGCQPLVPDCGRKPVGHQHIVVTRRSQLDLVKGRAVILQAEHIGDQVEGRIPDLHHFVRGGLMLGGNGTVCWAEQWVPSGETALILATGPLWTVVLPWIARRARAAAAGRHRHRRWAGGCGRAHRQRQRGCGGRWSSAAGGAAGAGRRQPELVHRIVDIASQAEIGRAGGGDGDGGRQPAAGDRGGGARRLSRLPLRRNRARRLGGAGLPGGVRQPGGLRVLPLLVETRGAGALVDVGVRQSGDRGGAGCGAGWRADRAAKVVAAAAMIIVAVAGVILGLARRSSH